MTRRATFTQADYNRAAKAAAAIGYALEIEPTKMRLLPANTDAANTQRPDQPDSDWDKALGLK